MKKIIFTSLIFLISVGIFAQPCQVIQVDINSNPVIQNDTIFTSPGINILLEATGIYPENNTYYFHFIYSPLSFF